MGQKAKFIDNCNDRTPQTIHMTQWTDYEILDENEWGYFVSNDSNSCRWYFKASFAEKLIEFDASDKIIDFNGKQHTVPHWANYIAMNPNGDILVFQNKPNSYDDGGTQYYSNGGQVRWIDYHTHETYKEI